MRHSHSLPPAVPPPQRCPSCGRPVSRRLHVARIAGEVILDCPTCWTTTVFDQAGRVVRRPAS